MVRLEDLGACLDGMASVCATPCPCYGLGVGVGVGVGFGWMVKIRKIWFHGWLDIQQLNSITYLVRGRRRRRFISDCNANRTGVVMRCDEDEEVVSSCACLPAWLLSHWVWVWRWSWSWSWMNAKTDGENATRRGRTEHGRRLVCYRCLSIDRRQNEMAATVRHGMVWYGIVYQWWWCGSGSGDD